MTSRPQEPFSDPRAELRARFRAILEGARRPTAKERIVYRITGGPPGKRLESELEISGSGTASHMLLDEMEGGKRARVRLRLAQKDVLELFRMVLDSGMLKADEATLGFLPDSLVGSVTVESGDARLTRYFPANQGHITSGTDEGRVPATQAEELAPLLPQLETMVARVSRQAK